MSSPNEPVKSRLGLNKTPGSNDKKVLECEICKTKFLVSETGDVETKIGEEEFLEYQKKKDIDPKNLNRFTCSGCKPSSRVVPSANFQFFMKIILSIVIIICSVIYFKNEILFYIQRETPIPVKSEVKTGADLVLESELSKLEYSYSNQIEDTWIILESGIKSVIKENPNQPSMFLLLFDDDSSEKTAECIAQDVSKPAIRYLMHKSGTPTVYAGTELNHKTFLDDPGSLLKELNVTVRRTGALVVTNLHEVSPQVVRMFHFVCDKYSPLVEKAVTFFTLKVNKVPSIIDQQSTVVKTMQALWSSTLDDNILSPLITRMTTNIIRIYPDSKCHVF